MRLIISIWLLAISGSLYAQKKAEPLKKFETFGFLVGYGSACPNYESYRILFITGDYSRAFRVTAKKSFAAYYLEPQFNFIKSGKSHDIEFGMNAGFRNYIRVNPDFYLYQMGGTGPHYITAKLKSQASGFIFSDNFFLGALTHIKHKYFLNLQAGIRHISNASLKKPNHGMNTFNFRVGISKAKNFRQGDGRE